ncbi:MAG: hypothetical protein ABI680_01345 [Chthoniobacteraceae bacterium]
MTFTDASPSGETLHSFTLDHLAERLTVREILRARIWQEVADFNQHPQETFNGLVQPGDVERTLNRATKPGEPRQIDWEAQFRRACEAFDANGFFVLIGDRQAESLDEEFDIGVETEVQFVKLTPLVGG